MQLLRDTLSGHARNQIEEIDLIADNYDLAWKRLEDVYFKKEECRGLLIDKVFGFQFNVLMDKFDETFNNYILLIEKLSSSHRIDLLSSDEGIDCVMAHLTFKKFPQTIKNVILTLSSTQLGGQGNPEKVPFGNVLGWRIWSGGAQAVQESTQLAERTFTDV